METSTKTELTVETVVNANLEKAWNYWTEPKHIMNWNNASPDWHTPKAENDLRVGGKFNYTMAARDGSFSFDFWGIYKTVVPQQVLEIILGDERKMKVTFEAQGNATKVVEVFEAETQNSLELQQNGWQAILDNFKKYVEAN